MTRLRRENGHTASARHVRKECRALVLPFLGTLLCVAGLARFAGRDFSHLAIPVYFIGVVGLGAFSVGHEYTYRTLPLLLVQPVSRVKLLAAKLIVLLPMLLVALALAAAVLPLDRGDSALVMLSAPPVVALCLAPWLTMVSRNVVAGVVFSSALPGVGWVLSDVAAVVLYGETRAADLFRIVIYGVLATGVCAAGAIRGLRQFLTLEVIEGRDAELDLTGWLPRSSSAAAVSGRRRSPGWMLVQKELHLQRMAFVLAALYGGLFAVVWAASEMGALHVLEGFAAVSLLYALLLAVLIGALSSAEERHLGTSDWQAMLPVASWRQWAIKVTVALMLAMLLSVGLPVVFAREIDLVQTRFIVSVLLITSGAIYISSRSSSGIHALLASFLVAPVLAFVFSRFVSPYLWHIGGSAPQTALALAVAVLFLGLGFLNHRRGEINPSRHLV